MLDPLLLLLAGVGLACATVGAGGLAGLLYLAWLDSRRDAGPCDPEARQAEERTRLTD